MYVKIWGKMLMVWKFWLDIWKIKDRYITIFYLQTTKESKINSRKTEQNKTKRKKAGSLCTIWINSINVHIIMVMNWIFCPPLQSYIETIALSVMELGDGPIGGDEVMRMEPSWMKLEHL